MPPPVSTSDSFITSLIHQLSLLTGSPPPCPNDAAPSLPSPSSSQPILIDPKSSTSLASPPERQPFSTIYSAYPKEKQEAIKHVLTTLHFLFPHEFIPALDLLDRGLVTRMIVPLPPTRSNIAAAPDIYLDIEHQQTVHHPRTDPEHTTKTQTARSEGGAECDASHRINPDDETRWVPENEVFYVQSASSQTITTHSTRHRRRHHASKPPATYEVRLAGWNCTCPAFAFSAFSRALTLHSHVAHVDDSYQPTPPPADHDSPGHMDPPRASVEVKWRFGGTLTRQAPFDLHPTGDVPAPARVPVCKHILATLLGKQIPGLFGSGLQSRTVSPEEGAGWAAGWGDGD